MKGHFYRGGHDPEVHEFYGSTPGKALKRVARWVDGEGIEEIHSLQLSFTEGCEPWSVVVVADVNPF